MSRWLHLRRDGRSCGSKDWRETQVWLGQNNPLCSVANLFSHTFNTCLFRANWTIYYRKRRHWGRQKDCCKLELFFISSEFKSLITIIISILSIPLHHRERCDAHNMQHEVFDGIYIYDMIRLISWSSVRSSIAWCLLLWQCGRAYLSRKVSSHLQTQPHLTNLPSLL